MAPPASTDGEGSLVPRTSWVTAIAELHRRHEVRVRRATTVRNAAIAAMDAVSAAVVRTLAARTGARVVPLAEAALAVHAPGPLPPLAAPPRAIVVDVDEYREMVAAYEATYRPVAQQEATRRARADASAQVHQARRGGRAAAEERAEAARRAGMRARELEQRGLSPAEIDLERRMREDRAA